MIIYAAALAAMFICQNGLTGVIQAPPRRPRPPRASKAPKPPRAPRKASRDALGSITITTPARPTRWLLLALASIARAGHDSEETYVIQALRPEAIPSHDVAVPDGVSNIALAPDAFAPGVAIVPAPGTEANVVADASEFFASACCGLGTSTGAGGHFCDERVERDAPGCASAGRSRGSSPSRRRRGGGRRMLRLSRCSSACTRAPSSGPAGSRTARP